MKNLGFGAAKVGLGALALVISFGAASAFAQKAAEPVESRLEARKVVLKDGKESFESAATAKPGDTIEYVATYTNKGRTAVSKLEATLPIPPNTEVLPNSLKPALAKASTGGAQYDAIPLKRKIKQPDGREIEQTVPLSEYRSLRWSLNDLAGGASTTVVARVKVVDDKPAAPAAK